MFNRIKCKLFRLYPIITATPPDYIKKKTG